MHLLVVMQTNTHTHTHTHTHTQTPREQTLSQDAILEGSALGVATRSLWVHSHMRQYKIHKTSIKVACFEVNSFLGYEYMTLKFAIKHSIHNLLTHNP